MKLLIGRQADDGYSRLHLPAGLFIPSETESSEAEPGLVGENTQNRHPVSPLAWPGRFPYARIAQELLMTKPEPGAAGQGAELYAAKRLGEDAALSISPQDNGRPASGAT